MVLQVQSNKGLRQCGSNADAKEEADIKQCTGNSSAHLVIKMKESLLGLLGRKLSST